MTGHNLQVFFLVVGAVMSTWLVFELRNKSDWRGLNGFLLAMNINMCINALNNLLK
jgi:hypothetical protein